MSRIVILAGVRTPIGRLQGGLKSITATDLGAIAIKESCEDQKKGITTFIEVILNQELGEPFRRDAMKKPVKIAGINKTDMKPQKSLN